MDSAAVVDSVCEEATDTTRLLSTQDMCEGLLIYMLDKLAKLLRSVLGIQPFQEAAALPLLKVQRCPPCSGGSTGDVEFLPKSG